MVGGGGGRKVDSHINALNKKNTLLSSTVFKILRHVKGN
jgi:hypothetical protein